jgi:membrane-associated phospholipid phosphatase
VTSILVYTTGLITLAAAVSRARALRASPSPSLRALCWALGCLSLAYFLTADDTLTLAGRVTGNPGIALWAGNSLTLAAACAALIMLAHLARRPGAPAPRTALRIAVVLAAVTAMAALTFSGPPARTASFGAGDAASPAVLACLLIYLTCLGAALGSSLALAVRLVPRAAARHVRTALRLIGSGSATGLIYVAARAALAASPWLGLRSPAAGPALATAMSCAAGLQLTAGGTAGAWGPPLSSWVRRQQQARSYRRLQPLWQALADAVPGIALAPEPGTDNSGIGYRLYRRVIEIRDGELALRAYRDPAAVARAGRQAHRSGISGRQLAAIIEAAAIASAVTAKATGRRPGDSTSMILAEPGSDLAAEIELLTRVSRAYASSPIIRGLLTCPELSPAARHDDRARSARQCLAPAVADGLAPALLVSALFLAAGWHAQRGPGLLWGLAAAGFAVAGPLAFVAACMITGRRPGQHPAVRGHPRLILPAIAAALLIAGMVILALAGAPRNIIAAGTAVLAGLAAGVILTRHGHKVSFRAAVAAAAASILAIIYGPPLLLAWLVVPLIGLSRVKLAHHTAAEVIAGAPIGSIVSALAFLVALRLAPPRYSHRRLAGKRRTPGTAEPAPDLLAAPGEEPGARPRFRRSG